MTNGLLDVSNEHVSEEYIFDFSNDPLQEQSVGHRNTNHQYLFSNFPMYSHLRQGGVGDCYLIAALKSILVKV
jgi:hypothetical protein